MLSRETKRKTHLTQTFQSEINQERGSRFLMDKTLYKGIKDHDVSKIIDVSKEAGQLGDKSLPNEFQQLEKIVIQMRRKYDEVRTQTVQVQSQLQKLRKTSETLKDQQKRLKQSISGAKSVFLSYSQNLENKQKQSETLFINVEARNYDLDIYKEMVATIKHDILIIKKRNFDKDNALKHDRTKMKSLKNDDFRKTQLSYKCRDMLQSVQKAVITKQHQRNSKLNTFYDALNKKHQNKRKQGQREKQIQQVMIKAMSKKLQEQKQWINICHVNLYLKRFLKCKMERLINQNAQIEGAYHKIRSNTDIKDCKDLITRFLNREKDYGTLLGSISEKEARLQSQRSQKQKLEAKNHELRQISEEISDSSHKSKQKENPFQKQLNEVEQALKEIQQKKELICKWATRFYCSFSNKTRDQISQRYQKRSLTQLIKDVLIQVSKFLDHLQGDQNCSDSINSAFMSIRPTEKTFGQEMVNRNKRVKTTAVEEQYLQGDQRDGNYDGNSEAQFLHYNRRLTKKNDINRRFRIKTQLK